MTERPNRDIQLKGVRQNNLKNVSVEFPSKKLSVVTGLSGSGKSSLVFDTLYAEGQRRYVESLSTYTRQFLQKMPKPDVDQVNNIPPSIALEQRNHVLNSRSTVSSQTEVIDYLRILFAKIGKTRCTDCNGEVLSLSPQDLVQFGVEWLPKRKAMLVAPITSGATPKTLFKLLLEQGFRRVLWKRGKKFVVIDLEEKPPAKFPKAPSFFVVVDRLRISSEPDSDTRTRILDSIEQCLAIGHGQMGFYDMDSSEFKEFNTKFACRSCGTEHVPPEPRLFSSNSPLGACDHCNGFGHTLDIDESLVVPDPTKTIKNGAIDPFSKPSFAEWQGNLFRFAERHGISVGKRYSELSASQKKLLWEGRKGDKTFPGILQCFKKMERYKYKIHVRVFIRRYQSQTLCRVCDGARLKPEALSVYVEGKNIAEVAAMSIDDAHEWFKSLKLEGEAAKIAKEVYQQIERRLYFLSEVGVGYLTLDRLTRSLSGGEFQRINLATQLGNGLCGTLYVLDEPSIGLHAADNERLIRVLERLRDQGNTVVVVEHDLEIMKRADWLVEIGPGAGSRGGELIAQGDAQTLEKTKISLTGKYLKGDFTVDRVRSIRTEGKKAIKLIGCRENNLKNIDVEFPLERLVVVSGVSGSGKSTLVHKTLYNALARIFLQTPDRPGRYERLYGADQISGVVLLDQKPIGKSSRSNPATYMKAWDEVRRIFANQVLALRRGYTPQYFSFNVDGGRCPVCKGEGQITLEMHFMADVTIPCEECDGKRFKSNVLDVQYKGKNISQILNTTIDEAFEIFRDNPILVRKLGLLREVGLGYLLLGQPAPTLSGGESQRLKVAATLDDKNANRLLYVFDEPTTGLHLEDVKRLMLVIQDLVEAKHSVVMIEHHLDVIAQADWLIDLGPGGGIHGGDLIAAGPPDQLIKDPHSVTAEELRRANYTFPERESRYYRQSVADPSDI